MDSPQQQQVAYTEGKAPQQIYIPPAGETEEIYHRHLRQSQQQRQQQQQHASQSHPHHSHLMAPQLQRTPHISYSQRPPAHSHSPPHSKHARRPIPSVKDQPPSSAQCPSPGKVTEEAHNAHASADALLASTKTGIVHLFETLVASVTRDAMVRDKELADARDMNGHIESDYRALYQHVISLQRIKDQLKGEVALLRLRKGDGNAVADVWGKIRGRENKLWEAIDRCIDGCKCGAARKTLSPLVLLPRAAFPSDPTQTQFNQHEREASAQSHVSSHDQQQQRRNSTESQDQSTTLKVTHRRFSTGSATAGSPVVHPNSASTSFSAEPAIDTEAVQFPTAQAVQTSSSVISPIATSSIGVQPTVPQPQPQPMHHTQGMTTLPEFNEYPSQGHDRHAPHVSVMSKSRDHPQAAPLTAQLLELAHHPVQAQNQNAVQAQTLAHQTTLIQLGDSNSTLLDALRIRAGLPPRPSPPVTSSTATRTRLLAELASRLRNLPPLDACLLLNLNAGQKAALSLVGSGTWLKGHHVRALEGFSKEERAAVAGLLKAVCEPVEVVDLTKADSPASEPQSLKVGHTASPKVSHPALDDAPSRRRARSDSGVGTDISDASGSDERERAPKRARMSIDEGVSGDVETSEASEASEDDITGAHLGRGKERSRDEHQTLLPDATPRLCVTISAPEAIESRTPSVPEARTPKRDVAPVDQGSVASRALPALNSHYPVPVATVPPLSSAVQTAFVNDFAQSLTNVSYGIEVEQILSALKMAESANRVGEGIIGGALAETLSASQKLQSEAPPPPSTPTPAPPPAASVPLATAPPTERTRSVPIELTFEVPATAQTTPARSREFTPSPFVQSIQNMQPESSVFNAHLAQPSTAIVQQPVQSGKLAQLGQDLQSEQLMQMGMQEGYDGPCNGLPPHPQMQSTGLPLQSSASSPLPPPMTMLQPPPEQVTDVLPHVPANLQDDGSGELPRLPDEAVEGTVLGLVHLELAFVLDGVVGGWVCRMCLQRKEEVDDTFPVPVYPSSSEDTMSDDMRGVMSTHCAQTHWDAFSCISQWSEEEAREELREMLEE